MPTSRTALTRPIAALAVACALAVSGCGGDDDEPTASTGTTASTTTSTGGTGTTDTTASGGTSTGGTSTGDTGGGTGGGGSGTSSAGGGDEATYVKTLESVCKRVAEESRTFVADVTKAGAGGGSSADSFAKLKGPMTRFFDAIDARYQELTRAQAPAKWEAYQASLRSDAEGVSKYLDEAKQLLDDADSPDDLSKLQELMGRTNFNTGDAPKDLAAKTPSCTPAGAASGAAGGTATVTTPTP